MSTKKRKKKKKSRYQRGIHISPIAGPCKYRSGWEAKLMAYLDVQSDIETWTYEQTVIEYISNIRNKKVRKYYPDFYVKYLDGRQEILEVKPKRKLDQLNVVKKVKAAEEWCAARGMSFKILTEVELKDMGLL